MLKTIKIFFDDIICAMWMCTDTESNDVPYQRVCVKCGRKHHWGI